MIRCHLKLGLGKSVLLVFNIKRSSPALEGVAQWIECWPVNLRVAGSIPSQGTYLGRGPSPQ